MQTVKLDTQNPTIKVSVSGKVATLTLGDNLGIVGYGVNQSTGTQPGYTAASGTSAQKTWTASAAGSYVAWVKDQAGRTATASFSIASTAFCAYSAGQVVKTFDYNGGIQSLKIPCNGTYKLEVWGAQGGNSAHGGTGGKGGYSYGNKTLTTSNTLYIGVGGQGTYYGESYHPTTGDTNGGYNGGGALVNTYWFSYTTTGGGATHIALNTNRGELKNYASYKSEVLIVAGGGGAGSFEEEDDEEGVYYSYVGGAGGGASGGNGSGQTNQPGYGATQSAGGKGAHGAGSSDGKFGYAGPAYGGANTATGGGGWYGGGTSGSNASAGGGSGYIGGVTGGVTTAGQRSGHGYARITLVSLSQ